VSARVTLCGFALALLLASVAATLVKWPRFVAQRPHAE